MENTLDIIDSNIYPRNTDNNFNIKIASKEEFKINSKKKKVLDIEEYSNEICEKKFSLAPHQIFVRNFLSFQTPYNSLILYHGVGTGKTCSAISIAEEMRQYVKKSGLKKKILIVASPNVQNNFRTQLFDTDNLIENNGIFSLDKCFGNNILNEINPLNKIKDKEQIIFKAKKLIDKYYAFFGYSKLANYIQKLSDEKLKNIFEDRLIIIDEVHNLRMTDDNKNKIVANNLQRLVEKVKHIKLLFLSATPMYNNYREIIMLLNLINTNDNKPKIKENSIFDKDGEFIIDENGNEIGKKRLIEISRGYISFIKGENPYSFPYRIYPLNHSIEQSFLKTYKKNYPEFQFNNVAIANPLSYIDLFCLKLKGYQSFIYNYITSVYFNKERSNDYEFESSGYMKIQLPLAALNITFPNNEINYGKETIDQTKIVPKEITGKQGFSNIVTNVNTYPFKYKNEYLEENKSIFHINRIQDYSSKIHNIINSVVENEGISLIYSQYLHSGLIPIACALEELGFDNYNSSKNFVEKSYKTKNRINKRKECYIIITGQKNISMSVQKEISIAISEENKNGNIIKAILISKAGSEGIDFKNIRNVHILEPWFNMNRIEQIIGRAIRNCSHKKLPFSERNVNIYLYGTILDTNIEAIDFYVYRGAEKKALQIGAVSRLLKETSIDCILQEEQSHYSIKDLDTKVNIKLPNKKIIEYQVGDKPYTEICDYMESCNYQCKIINNENNIIEVNNSNISSDSNTIHSNHISLNKNLIKSKIKELYGEYGKKMVYSYQEIWDYINFNNEYNKLQIDMALHDLTNSKMEIVVDRYGNSGNIILVDDIYIYQPTFSKNIQITMENRNGDIDRKRQFIKIKKQKEKKNNNTLTKENIDIKNILTVIKDQYNDILQSSKYAEIFNTINIMFDNDFDNYKEKIIVDYILEYTNNNDILRNLFIYFAHTIVNEDNKIDFHTYNYLHKHYLKNSNNEIVGFIIPNKKKYNFFIYDNDENQWILSNKLEDKRYFDQLENKYNVDKKNLAKIIGFVYDSGKKNNIIEKNYRLKITTETYKRFTSKICEFGSKDEIFDKFSLIDNKLKDFLDDKILKKITKPKLCLLHEFILRYYNEIYDKIWFLTIIEAAYGLDGKHLNLIS